MKDKIRNKLKDKRAELSKSEIFEKSNRIKKKLFQMEEFKKTSCQMFYISYDNEVYTHDMIKENLKNKKKVIVPVSDIQNRCLILSELHSWNDLKLGSYKILEPIKNKIKKVSIDKIDMIIVPGLGFDKQGKRIGHGMGYYDNLLSNSKNAVHIGLAFELQLVKKIPVDAHDIPVHKIITEERVIDCKLN